jgi:cell division protein ZapA
MTMRKKNAVKVTIGGDEYTLKSDRPPEYTRAVAEHVDRTLGDVLSGATMVETHKAAILAALAITDELFQARRSQREMARRLQSLAGDLSRLLPPNKRNPLLAGQFASTTEGT